MCCSCCRYIALFLLICTTGLSIVSISTPYWSQYSQEKNTTQEQGNQFSSCYFHFVVRKMGLNFLLHLFVSWSQSDQDFIFSKLFSGKCNLEEVLDMPKANQDLGLFLGVSNQTIWLGENTKKTKAVMHHYWLHCIIHFKSVRFLYFI